MAEVYTFRVRLCELKNVIWRDIEKTNKDGTLPKITDGYSGEETVWDYRDFDLAYCNMFFKNDVLGIQTAYEMYE